jgi:hypothetical protein
LDNEDMERLANRLALLVSDTGEADNAGRAAGALARRLGLSGGDLKAMFLAGATGRPSQTGGGRGRAEDFSAMARQISALQHSLSLVEVSARKAERERDALREENETLRVSLDRRGTSRQVGRIVGSTLIAAIVIGGVYTIARPVFREPAGAASAAPAGAPFAKAAIVRAAGARLYSAPNRGAPVITFVPNGTRLTVKRLVVNVLTQWAEVEFSGREGYVATSDVDMP